MSVSNTKTTPADSGGQPESGMAFRRLGVRIPPGPPDFDYNSDSDTLTFPYTHTPV